nr:MAG TPA: hypothetical protein [Caudoviricetes sp.]DAR56344.1 MAG TPA: hypothetical protein [Caudoviricetes sp.]
MDEQRGPFRFTPQEHFCSAGFHAGYGGCDLRVAVGVWV